MRPVQGMVLAAAGMVVLAGQTVLAQAINSVPDNALVMVKVNNLEQTSKKLGDLFQQWGITAFNPKFSDPLVALEGLANLQQGLNRAGEGAFIFVNPMGPGGQGAAPIIVMLPVSDYDAFIKNFPDAQADGELTMVTLPLGDSETGYIAKWGTFAAISPNRALVARAPKATKLDGLAAKEMQGRDIVAYVNFPGFRNQAAGALSIGRGAAIGQIDQAMQQQPNRAKYSPLAIAAFNQVFNGLDHMVNETRAMTIGIDLSHDGVQLTSVTDFVPESYLAKMVTTWKPQSGQLVSGLPTGKYIAVGGAAFDNATFAQLVADITDPIRAEAVTLGNDGKPIVGYIDALKATVAATASQTFGAGVGQGELGKSSLADIVVVNHGDVDKLVGAQRDIAQYQEQFMQLFQPQGPGAPQTATEFKPAVKTVGGITFDQVTTTVTGAANDPGAKVMQTLYGPGGLAMLMGKIDAKTLLATSYKQDAQIQSAIAAAKSGNDPLTGDAQVKAVSAKLPQNSCAVLYVFPEQLMGMISRASQAISGVALQTKLPPNVQPIALSGNTEGTAVRFSMYVPSSVVQAGVSTALQQGMQQGQQRRPRPAGPGAAPAQRGAPAGQAQ